MSLNEFIYNQIIEWIKSEKYGDWFCKCMALYEMKYNNWKPIDLIEYTHTYANVMKQLIDCDIITMKDLHFYSFRMCDKRFFTQL
ncbi:MAG: hypothetical protein IKV83_00400 [Muribaculaceae bacterium]|nr:hypothetical protein [Muribaculaceae bacterium]